GLSVPWDRKTWEIAMALRTLRTFGAVRPDAAILGCAAGLEDTIYRLAPFVREVTVIDRYLHAGQWDSFAPPWMPLAPELGARAGSPSDGLSRIHAAHMDARCLRFEDDSFDGVFSSGSIEHFGGLLDIAHAAYEIGRVLKPGGVASISTELLLRGPREPHVLAYNNMIVLRPDQIRRYIIEASGLEPIDELHVQISSATRASRQALLEAAGVHNRMSAAAGLRAEGWNGRFWTRPFVALELDKMLFGSVHIALKKTAAFPHRSNAWAQPGPDLAARLTVERRSVMTGLGQWGSPVPSLSPRQPGAGRLAAAAGRLAAQAAHTYNECTGLQEEIDRARSEILRMSL